MDVTALPIAYVTMFIYIGEEAMSSSQLERYSTMMIQNQVISSSQATYANAWEQWIKFCTANHVCQETIQPQGNCKISSTNRPFKVNAILGYMSTLYFISRKSPKTIKGYLAGIAYHFRVKGLDMSFYSHDAISGARKGIANLYYQSKKSTPSKVPFTLDMIHIMRTYVVSYDTPIGRCIILAAITALVMILRISEYVYAPKNVHYLKPQSVLFYGKKDNAIVQVDASKVHNFALSELMEVKIIVQSSKTDKEKKGKVRVFARRVDLEYCMVKAHYEWCKLARPTLDRPYFNYRNHWNLTASDITNAMKQTASLLDINPKYVTSHSFRYGGATSLVAADFTPTLVRHLGGWKSDTALDYMKVTPELSNKAASAVLDLNKALSYKNVKKILK